MNFRQLRSLCVVVDCGLKIASAANALNRSQPSISRQLQELEEELKINVFVRNRNRILGVTPQGKEIVALARRLLADEEALKKYADESENVSEGDFVIATSHTQARYGIPQAVASFMCEYPKVNLSLRQGEAAQCYALVAEGKADLAVCMNLREIPDSVISIPCYKVDHCVIVPARHPLLRIKPLTLEGLIKYPIIAYSEGTIIGQTFAEHGMKPRIVFNSLDTDISKTYVELGLGVAILASASFDPNKDTRLRRIDASHLFRPNQINVAVRSQNFLRSYMQSFIRYFAPHIRKSDIRGALTGKPHVPTAKLPVAPYRNL